MAENPNDKDDQADAEKEGQAANPKKRLMLLGILALVLVGLSVGLTLTVLSIVGDDPAVEEIADEAPAEDQPEPIKRAIYYPVKPEIVVDFDARGRRRYLQADVTLLTRDNDVIAAIEMHMPMIRNALNLVIGGQTYEEIQTAEGKELMRIQCLQELQRLMEKEIGKPGIDQVLFTSLVMQ